ncbi:MAG: carbon-nitrogen hydrolase family protein [Agarilytica sp.]
MSKLNVAAIQMLSCSSEEKNLQAATRLLGEAKLAGADVAVLPENFLTYGSKNKPSLVEQKAFIQNMSDMARRQKLWVVAGSYPMAVQSLVNDGSGATQKPFATSMVFDSSGQVSGQYKKIHLFDAQVGDHVKTYRESDEYAHGVNVETFGTPWGTFGLAICYDLRFPEMFIRLAQQGAKVIFVPAAFTEVTGRAHWEILLRARAIESQCYIVAANQGGRHDVGRATWGQSMIVSPWGEIMSELAQGEGLLVEALDLAAVDDIRRDMPVQAHRRLF